MLDERSSATTEGGGRLLIMYLQANSATYHNQGIDTVLQGTFLFWKSDKITVTLAPCANLQRHEASMLAIGRFKAAAGCG